MEEDLNNFWRTNYDILVRPADAITNIEQIHNIVEANHLSNIFGGISFEQYDLIREMPGVEVAAPISMMGYFLMGYSTEPMPFPPEVGVYRTEESFTTSDGVIEQTVLMNEIPKNYKHSELISDYYFFDRNPNEPPPDILWSDQIIDKIMVNSPNTVTGGRLAFYFLLAAIDPVQEAALFGIDKTVVVGDYLKSKPLPILDRREFGTISITNPNVVADESDYFFIDMPLLVNPKRYIDITHFVQLQRVILPPGISNIDDVLVLGGNDYLSSLPTEVLDSIETDGDKMFKNMFEELVPKSLGKENYLPRIQRGSYGPASLPGPILYQEINSNLDFDGLILELLLPETKLDQGLPAYREPKENIFYSATAMWDIKGVFDVDQLRRPDDVNSVPMETYFPPIAILRYDEEGNAVDGAPELHPSYNPNGYIQSPPSLLTTIEAARTLLDEEPISAIRIRVSDIEDFTPASQRKVEAIALEIAKQTGLTVDIMIGSSPTRVLVKVPGIGFVEEQWIEKEVTLKYRQGIQLGNWLLMIVLLIAGSVFVLDITWVESLSRRHIIALQKAMGWYSRTVFRQIVGQISLISLGSTILGSLSGIGIVYLSQWQMPPLPLLIGLPLVVLILAIVSSLIPAWKISREAPIHEIQGRGVRIHKNSRWAVRSLWAYVWKELRRHPTRTIMTAINSSVSSALLVFLISVTWTQQGMLGGTLLGEFILVSIEGLHYVIVALGFFLAALSTSNGLLSSIHERRSEISLLWAIGWHTKLILRVFVMEGALLGLLGGIPGAVLSGLMVMYFYQTVSMPLIFTVLIGILIPGGIGALASVIPGHIAATIPPAEALRYE